MVWLGGGICFRVYWCLFLVLIVKIRGGGDKRLSRNFYEDFLSRSGGCWKWEEGGYVVKCV